MRAIITSFLTLIFLSISANAQTANLKDVEDSSAVASVLQRDSLTTVSASGDTTVCYLPYRFDFGELPTCSLASRALMPSEECVIEADEDGALQQSAWSSAIDTACTAGQIPYEECISPSGARTYSVPVATVPGFPLVPSVRLQYNSQAGNGVAGYGWSVGGLSSITLTNKNIYYHGTCDEASNSDSVYSLDGMPLVQNSSIMSDTYPLIAARGNILARTVCTSGYARQFEVLYPDGTRAEYGVSSYSSAAVLSFPVTRIEDVQGNYMTFSYTEWNGVYHITDIWYGGDSSRPPTARIHFEYDDREDHMDRYFLGRVWSESKLLKSVASSGDGEELRTYTLSHDFADGVSLLSGISCSVGGGHLNPLSFGYDNDSPATDDFVVMDSLTLSSAFTQSGYEFICRRGKLVPDSYGDGIIVYPSFSTYGQLERRWVPFDYRYRYGSTYDPDQSILVFPYGRSSFCQARAILAGEGFQTAEAVDVDGDGVDEIVKVNSSSSGSDRTDILVTVYEYDTDTSGFTSRSFTTYISGNVSNPQYTSPSQIACWFGDYVGDGKAKLMVYSYARNAYGKSQTSEGTIIDLESGAVLKRQSLFSLSLEDAKNVISLDIDSDSRTEFCRLTPSGLATYSYRGADSGFTLDASYPGIAPEDLPGDADSTFVTDLNADGYVDFVSWAAASDTWNVKSFDGIQFVDGAFHAAHETGDRSMFIDVDRDGLPDLAVVRSGILHVYLNENGAIDSTLLGTCPVSDANGIVPCNITDYNGMSSLIKVDGFHIYCYSFTDNHQERRLLTSFRDSFGVHSENVYREMSSCTPVLGYSIPEVYDTDDSLPACGSGFARVTMPEYLLYRETARLHESGTVQVVKDNYYRYFNATASNQGLGFCGFRQIRATDTRGGSSQWRISNTYYDPEKFGCVIRQEQGLRNQSPVTVTELTYDSNFTTYGKLNPRLVGMTKTDALTGVTSTASYTYGSYDLPTTIQTSRRIGAGTAQIETASRTYQNSTSTSRYVLGAVSAESVTRESDGSSATSWQSRTVMTYDGNFRPLTKKSYVGTTGSNLVSEQQWQYDSHGNVTCERTAAYGATTFNETSYTYDSLGRHMTSATDALGRTTSYSGHDIYGNPSQATDWLGRVTSYGYDIWGHLTQTTLPDGTVQTSTSSWSASGEPGLVRITETSTGSPDTKTWSDALGREVRSAGRRFDGGWRYSDREYDSRGRLLRTSLPYRDTTAGPSLWNTYTYDDYDRPVRLDEAGGKNTTWAYSGTSTSTTAEGISSTSTTDASGNVVSVTDQGGTITYALRDDAQPSSVTVTHTGSANGIVTAFSYDAFGRRISMTDPSAGARTTSYTDNADGTGSVASTGPNGTVTTSYDRYGRVTSVTRPEFNTTYTYGTSPSGSSYGKLLGESSTNGTARTFTYDDLGRVLTETEKADSTHWLRKTYSYGSGSSVASVSYSTQDGYITTESFEYTNGYGTAVTIPAGDAGTNSTTVWRMTAENALGQPTAMTTGTARRSYAFSAAGIPQARTVSSAAGAVIQDLSYSYDAVSGNMLWRQDNAVGYRETFTYDGLDRLLSSLQTFTGDDVPELDYGHACTSYSHSGNVTGRDNDGILDLLLDYADTSEPYRVTGCRPDGDGAAYMPEYGTVTMTSFDRPSGIAASGSDAATTVFTYNAAGERTGMTRDEDQYGIHMDRHYLGGVYERDVWRGGDGEDVERLFLGGTAYDAPMVLVKAQSVNDGVWTPFNIFRDVQGSVTEVVSADGGTVVESFRYDPWGLRTMVGMAAADSLVADLPEGGMPDGEVADSTVALSGWQLMGQSLYIGGHGYTGHEHLPGWGLINMNARLYDPALCRFLSPDPVLQDPANTQNFNRYSYCLNNPLRYTDESGEVFGVDDAVAVILCAAILSGSVNLAATWKRCEGFWEHLTSFFVGVSAGAAVAATGGAAAAAGGGIMATAGIVGTGVVSGAATGATNDILAQTGKNFEGIGDIDWNQVAINAAASGVAGGVSSGVGLAMAGSSFSININGNIFRSPVLSSYVVGSFSSAAGHIAGGTTAGLLSGYSLGDAFENSLAGIGTSALMGGTFAAASTVMYDLTIGINPVNGRALSHSEIIYTPARNLEEHLALQEAMSNDATDLIFPSEKIRSYEWHGWDKMQYIHHNGNMPGIGYLDNGQNMINIHYYQKTSNGVINKSGFKFKP